MPFGVVLGAFLLPVAIGLLDLPATAQTAMSSDPAVADLLAAAHAGDPSSQNDLGVRYEAGRGVGQDFERAAHWYRLAADQGHPVAQANLGHLYFRGAGVAQNDSEALRLFRAAARQGLAVAQNGVAVMYHHGRGVDVDYGEALRFYRLAAEQGFALAQSNIGSMYIFGRGVPQDHDMGLRWTRLAADAGDSMALNNMGVIYQYGLGVAVDHAEAMQWYRRSLSSGPQGANTEALALANRNVGVLYAEGLGVDRDPALARRHFEAAISFGHATAAEDLRSLDLDVLLEDTRVSPVVNNPLSGPSPLGELLTLTLLAVVSWIWLGLRKLSHLVRPPAPLPAVSLLSGAGAPLGAFDRDSSTVVVGAESDSVPRGAAAPPPATPTVVASPSASASTLPILQARLGRGGFGTTWRALDPATGDRVAVKVYSPGPWSHETEDGHVSVRSDGDRRNFEWGLKQFLQEARLLASVRHPGIVSVRRSGRAFGSAYLVMDLVEGPTLRTWLAGRSDRPDFRVVRAALRSLAAGLQAVHVRRIIHRDVKPANIILPAPGRFVLIDFGSARHYSHDLSHSLTAVLTPGYAPIEQYDRKGRQGPWTDVYALAAIGHEFLTGARPPDAPARALDPVLPQLDALSRCVGSSRTIDAVRAGLAVDAKDRLRSCPDFLAALAGSVAGARASARRADRPLGRVPEDSATTRIPASR